jgi:integrase
VTRLQQEINLDRRHVWVAADQNKNGRAHAVPLNELATEVLAKRQSDHPTQVFTYEGDPVTQVNTKPWRNALKRAGIEDFRWHDLRHNLCDLAPRSRRADT